MSALSLQESVYIDDEVSQLRKHAANKGIQLSNLENEFLKKDNELREVTARLNEAIQKFRSEADRVLKLEADVQHLKEDAAAERIVRDNLEVTAKSAADKLAAEEKTARSLQLEIESYASRTSLQHAQELRRVQGERTMLERQLKALEAQVQANKFPQPPSRLPRPTTMSNAASTGPDARIASLEYDLSKARRELEEVKEALTKTHQEASKASRLQTDLIASENARMVAENSAKAAKQGTKDLQDRLQEQEQELQYWRSNNAEKSMLDNKVEEAERARDDALQSLEKARRREASLVNRIETMEDKEIELVVERDRALNELHCLQEGAPSRSSSPDDHTLQDLYTTLAERETALLSVRETNVELRQLYQDALAACDAAEARIRELEKQLHPTSSEPPLIVVSPPPSPDAPKPYMIQPQLATQPSPEYEAIVARLLTAIDRLRSERDSLRRNLHFAEAENKATIEALESRLASITRSENIEHPTDYAIQRVSEELDRINHGFEYSRTDSTCQTDRLGTNECEMEIMREHIQELEQQTTQYSAKAARYSQLALVALLSVQYLENKIENEVAAKQSLLTLHQELTCNLQYAVCTRDGLEVSYKRTEAELESIRREKDCLSAAHEGLRNDLAEKQTCLIDAAQVMEQKESRISDLHSEVQALQIQISNLQYEVHEAREELVALESRQMSEVTSSGDTVNVSCKAVHAQVEVLEQRVLRRTEQIGILQHDNKRLETNLCVAEETITEMTTELETLGLERTCLVEDCAQAREERDGARQMVEELEIQLEALNKAQEELIVLQQVAQNATDEATKHESIIDTLIHVIVDFTAKGRTINRIFKQGRAQLSSLDVKVVELESQYATAVNEVDRLTSELEVTTSTLRSQTKEIETLTGEITSAHEDIRGLSSTLDRCNDESQLRRHNLDQEMEQLTTIIHDLETQLAASQSSKAAISQELEVARSNEVTLRARLEQLQGQSSSLLHDSQRLSTELATLHGSLDQERMAHAQVIVTMQTDFEREAASLREQLEADRQQIVVLRTEHRSKIQELSAKLDDAEIQLEDARKASISHVSIETELRRLQAQHAEDKLVFRSKLQETEAEGNDLRDQLNAVTEELMVLHSDYNDLMTRYESTQVELRGIEQALLMTRAQVNEQDLKIWNLQHERKTMEMKRSELDAELDKVSTKYQYAEQQYKRSEHDSQQLKVENNKLRSQNIRIEEAAQSIEINLGLKVNQLEQKLASTERELERHKEHQQCSDAIAGLTEKQTLLEESLSMANREIEEKDDRMLESLKEEKRLRNKIESLTRKIKTLQSKVAAHASTPPSTGPTSDPLVRSISQPVLEKRHPTSSPPPVPAIPSELRLIRPLTRIPSSPGLTLRSKTPDVSRVFSSGLSAQIPLANNAGTPTTLKSAASSIAASSSSRKRHLPDDFASADRATVQAMVEPGVRITTPHKIRRRPSGGFTPTRQNLVSSVDLPLTSIASQPQLLRRRTAPLAETTNSPRDVAASLGLGKPATAPTKSQSWLSKGRAFTGEKRTASARPS